MVSIYRRPDAYYVLRSARTTTGLWLGRPERPVVLDVDTSADSLGQQVLSLLSQHAEVVPHPRQDEWTEQGRAFRGPILSQAGVRSWRAFLAPADLVDVSRQASLIKVIPLRRDRRRSDVFNAIDTETTELTSPPSGDLGPAIIAAFSSA
ncbi:hypothetical protein E1218_08755 [Kribbella turkmenica]|uniref:Uncharacterized protein n=1 Tax=Kribbella turkmenica TaxID=2530375 RepID=A0A4R4XBP9_9ACTN|nr:hypothetical protein [Kribbella turkmenica]TDD28013.1 hypothetical protein E1218_08755 [Kribbella turkmenica]